MTAAPTRTLPKAPPAPPRRAPGRVERRASERVRRRRRSLFAIVAAGVVGLSGLVAVGPRLVSDGLGLLPSGGGDGAPKPVTVLVAFGTDTPRPSLVLFGHSGGARSVLLVPSATQVEVPSLGSATLAQALEVDGPDALGLALANALAIHVDHVVALDATQTQETLSAAGEIEVRFREPVRIGDKGWGEGTHALSSADVAGVLAAPTDDELTRLVTVHALVEGWLAGLDDGELDEVPLPDSARKVLGRLAGEDVRFDLLPVDGLGLPDERYQIDKDRAAEAARGLFPRLLYDGGPDGRVRVEIRNGSGRVGVASDVASKVVPAGAEVVLTGNAASFSVPTTVLVLHDPDRREDAERLRKALGVGELRLATEPVSVVDVSIVVGADYRPGG